MRRVASVVVVVVVYTEFDNTIEINRTFESENQVQNYRSTRVIISEYISLYDVSMKRRAQLTYMLCVCVRVLYYYINMKLFDYIYVFTYIYIHTLNNNHCFTGVIFMYYLLTVFKEALMHI